MLYKNHPEAQKKLNELFETIKVVVNNWEDKKANLFIGWILRKLQYLESEDCYVPKEDNFYKRGQIVHVDFGFNVGSEDGGERFAVVIWSPQNSKTMTVIPLTSCEIGNNKNANPKNKCNESKISSFPLHVDLGELMNDHIKTIAKVEQIRVVSKLRVSPISKKYKTYHVPGSLMEKINDAIKIYSKR